MSTAFPHCSLESKARAGWLNAPPVPGAAPQTLCHYGQSAPADLGAGCPQGARLKAPRRSDRLETEKETPMQGATGACVSFRSMHCYAAKILAPARKSHPTPIRRKAAGVGGVVASATFLSIENSRGLKP
jgi:hypothetical protein